MASLQNMINQQTKFAIADHGATGNIIQLNTCYFHNGNEKTRTTRQKMLFCSLKQVMHCLQLLSNTRMHSCAYIIEFPLRVKMCVKSKMIAHAVLFISFLKKKAVKL